MLKTDSKENMDHSVAHKSKRHIDMEPIVLRRFQNRIANMEETIMDAQENIINNTVLNNASHLLKFNFIQ